MKRLREPQQDLRPDPLAADGQLMPGSDAACESPAKIAELDPTLDEARRQHGAGAAPMKCSLPPHKLPITFDSYSDYEAHYHTFHTHRCLECHKNFPSDHLLGVHIEECHDPLVSIQRQRGEHTYSCFVEGCERKCLTHQKRRMHLIDKHMYPKNYFFAVTKEGIDGRRSLLVDGGYHHRKSSASAATAKSDAAAVIPQSSQTHQDVASSSHGAKDAQPAEDRQARTDVDMDHLSGAMSALQFVPPRVRFGRGRAGFSRK